jgi:hypothetical protein
MVPQGGFAARRGLYYSKGAAAPQRGDSTTELRNGHK